MNDLAAPLCKNRLFEWTMAFALLGLGVHLAVWPHAMGASAFRFILEVVGSQNLTIFYLMVGIFRIVALVANGRWQTWGPRVRALAALCGAGVWLQMDIALLKLVPEVGSPPSPGIPVYSALFLAELVSTYRAAVDGRIRDR